MLSLGMAAISACGAGGALSQPAEAAVRAEQCESRWSALYGQHGDSDRAVLEAEWRKAAEACQGTGSYEYHLAAILRLRGDLAGAIALLERVDDAPFSSERQALLLGMKFDEAFLAEPPDLERARATSAALEELLSRRPRDYVGLTELAVQKGQLGDHEGAITLAARVLAGNPDDWPAKRILVVAYAELRRCAEAKRHIRSAVESRETLLADHEFMLASAFCYLETGDVLTAEQVLLALQTHSPGVEQETGFQNIAARVLRAKSSHRE